jgi:hypothetical protein
MTIPMLPFRAPCQPPEIGRLVLAGADVYRRALVLPRLLPLGPADLVGEEPALTRSLCARLARALRSERNRGRAGHWSYDLNRHIGLMQALKAERRSLGEGGGAPVPRLRDRSAAMPPDPF